MCITAMERKFCELAVYIQFCCIIMILKYNFSADGYFTPIIANSAWFVISKRPEIQMSNLKEELNAVQIIQTI